MSAEYAPGTVAIATVQGAEGVRVSRYDGGWARLDDPDHFYNDFDCPGCVTNVRSLVVLDLTEYEANELASWLDGTDALMGVYDRVKVAREIRRQTRYWEGLIDPVLIRDGVES